MVSPIQNMARTVTRDLEFREPEMGEGDQVVLFYPSANRDEDVFADPQVFDIRRQPNPHIAFGFGRHYCLGASLARLELKVMFSELLRRLPDIQLATGDVLPRPCSNSASGLEAMPVRFIPCRLRPCRISPEATPRSSSSPVPAPRPESGSRKGWRRGGSLRSRGEGGR